MAPQLVLVVLLSLTTACASRGPSPQLVAAAGHGQTLVMAGCYRCLQDALATFEQLAATPNAPPEARRSAFTAAVLLVVRSRELGLPVESALERARLLRDAVPAASPGLSPDAYWAALQLVAGEMSGYSPEQRETRGRELRALRPSDGSVPAAREALTPALETDVVAQYLALTIDCEDARALKTLDTGPILTRYPMPLITFRAALCLRAPDQLRAVREADARWVDTWYFEGVREMAKYPVPDVGRAADLFAEAHAAFPDSPAVTLALANARNALGEYESALALFNRVLASEPTHRDGLLGRVLSLSYLNRHSDAIRTATQLIDLGTFHQGDAFYWRAWNRYRVHLLPAAWEDVTSATRVMVNTSVYTLAGFIAYAQQRLDVAIERLAEAHRLDQTNCEAVWTEALVHVDKQDWAPASARFVTSVQCFAAAAEQARRDRVVAQTADWAEPLKARRMAAAQKRQDTAEHRHAQAAYNAAGSFARLKQKAEALTYLEMAAQHALLKEKAAALRTSIDKLP